MVVFLFWQPQIDNIRTEISLYEAEIQEILDLLEVVFERFETVNY